MDTFRLWKKLYILVIIILIVFFQVNLNDVLNTDTVMPVRPETASIKHHAEVYIYGPIHTYTFRHI